MEIPDTPQCRCSAANSAFNRLPPDRDLEVHHHLEVHRHPEVHHHLEVHRHPEVHLHLEVHR